VLREYTRQLSPLHPWRSYTHSLGTLLAFTRLATKRCSLPKEKTATHPVEFLHQLNSVSRTTYILTISPGHTRRIPHLLSQKTITLFFTRRHKVQNQPPNSHNTPAFIKLIRRRYFPPHHRTHQPNPLQHRERTHHPNSNGTCTCCKSIPVPAPPPDPKVHTPTSYRSHSSFLWLYILCSTMVLTIFYVPLNLNSPIHTHSVLFTVFVLCFCYCKRWGSRNA